MDERLLELIRKEFELLVKVGRTESGVQEIMTYFDKAFILGMMKLAKERGISLD